MVSSEAVKAAVAVALLLQSTCFIGVWGALHDITVEGGEEVHWDYSDGPHGPAHWGELKPEWGVCRTGKQQSPLAVDSADIVSDPDSGPLDLDYRFNRTPATIANEGHAVVVEFPEDRSYGLINLYVWNYYLRQFHYHMPSEHRIAGKSFPLEIHQVYRAKHLPPRYGGILAVVSFLFYEAEGGGDNEFLAQFADKIPAYGSPTAKKSLGNITMLQLGEKYGWYIGSLTTPPCTEDVSWIINWNVLPASKRQLKQLRAALPHTNNRPTFPSAGRGFKVWP